MALRPVRKSGNYIKLSRLGVDVLKTVLTSLADRLAVSLCRIHLSRAPSGCGRM